MKNKTKKYIKYITLSVVLFLIIIGFIVIRKYSLKDALTSAYTLSSIEENPDKVKIGDYVEYEINGYKDWQILYIDKENETIDVVSRTNVEDLTFYVEDIPNASEIMQETANKYIDNKKAIRARSVNKADLDSFEADEQFWLDNVNESSIETNVNIWKSISSYQEKLFVALYIRLQVEDPSIFNEGDIYNYSLNGVEEWYIVTTGEDSIVLIPKEPLYVRADLEHDLTENAKALLDSFNVPQVAGYGNLISEQVYGNYDGYGSGYGYGKEYVLNKYSEYLLRNTNEDTVKYFYIDNTYTECGEAMSSGEYGFARSCSLNVMAMYIRGVNNIEYYSQSFNYPESIKNTLGFRPVVTLKINSKSNNNKDINSDIKPGDNVKYEGADYKNWKVLSIDKDKNTVDIISGGIVHNMQLRGQEDYNNLEDIIEREVGAYRNGENVISARSVTYDDRENLIAIGDKVNAKYWINQKKEYTTTFNGKSNFSSWTGTANAPGTFYDSAVMYYDNKMESILRKWATLNIFTKNGYFIEYYLGGSGIRSYTAGIRPVITLKMDDVVKLDDEELKSLEKSEKNYNKRIYNEQEIKNKDEMVLLSNDTVDEKDNLEDSKVLNDNVNNRVLDIKKGNDIYDYILFIIITFNLVLIIYCFIKKCRK